MVSSSFFFFRSFSLKAARNSSTQNNDTKFSVKFLLTWKIFYSSFVHTSVTAEKHKVNIIIKLVRLANFFFLLFLLLWWKLFKLFKLLRRNTRKKVENHWYNCFCRKYVYLNQKSNIFYTFVDIFAFSYFSSFGDEFDEQMNEKETWHT